MSKLILSIALALSILAGCNRNPTTYPVSGRVHFPSGSPVRMGTIETKSRDHGLNARGTINSDGTFQLSTFEQGDGAASGWHDCVVVQMMILGEEFGGKVSTFGVVDPKHNSYSSSGLSFEVSPDQPNEIKLEVSPFRGKETPEKAHKH